MAFLKLDPKECSPLGRFVLAYMEETGTSMNQLADRAGVTRPGLRKMCLIRGNPTESSLIRLAHAMGVPPAQLYKLAYQNKIENPYNPDAIDFFINGVDTVHKALHEIASQLPENQRPSDNELLESAIKTIKSSFAT
ncbi:helix-turn-helix domain-containing protein [Tolypothrix sp. VBCCA 56010]|uniref:helix-turn-helix domain-containing protein n=1 Tax=Tolypothrix sp. VBCCA 56010 TaxID=3137731 RepID=UPI003D7C5228